MSETNADKKDVIDYLRNQQKAAEIEAQVNGINLWVLIGAIAVVAWQLIELATSKVFENHELFLRVLMVCEAALFFSWLCAPTRGHREEIRLTSWISASSDTPLLVFLQHFCLIVPPVAFILVVGKSWSAMVLLVLASASIIVSIYATVWKFRNANAELEILPTPSFALSWRADTLGNLLLGVLFAFVILDQAIALSGKSESIPRELAKALALSATLFWLVTALIRRRLVSHSNKWTYELETDLVLGVVSAEVALRRIEYRALGRNLQDVVSRFFNDFDKKFTEFDASLHECRDVLSSVNAIPMEYTTERDTRIKEACVQPNQKFEVLLKDCKSFTAYLKKLMQKKSDPRMASVLENLVVRNEANFHRIKVAKQELDKARESVS